jgi:transcriptional regulator with XRE-family HTH domain
MKASQKVGERIRFLRLSKKMSQETLANIAGIDRTYIPKVELGKMNITVDTLQRIADALQVHISEFFIDPVNS